MSTIDEHYVKYYTNGRVRMLYTSDPDDIGIWVEWYHNGRIKEESYLTKDKPNGITRSWYDTGQLKEESHWVHGAKHGRHRAWNEGGVLLEDTAWENDEYHGLCKWMQYDISVLHTRIFNHGTDISEIIEEYVSDIKNITDHEKTIIAIHLGVIL